MNKNAIQYHINSDYIQKSIILGKNAIISDNDIIKWEFLLKNGSYCTHPTGHFSSFDDARAECLGNVSCQGLYNEKCDIRLGFKICTEDSRLGISYVGDCIHIKQGKLSVIEYYHNKITCIKRLYML